MVQQTRTRITLSVTLGSVVATVLALSWCWSPTPTSAQPAEKADTKATFVLALRTERGLNKEDIERNFKKVLDHANAQNAKVEKGELGLDKKIDIGWSDLKAFVSNKAGYEQLQAMIDGKEVFRNVDTEEGKPWMRRRPASSKSVFDLYTGDPGDDILAMHVTFKKEEEKPASFFLVPPKKDKDAKPSPLTYYASKGLYQFDQELATQQDPRMKAPTRFTLEIQKADNSKTTLGPLSWPIESYDYWTIRLSSWKGDMSSLIKLMGDKKILNNPYDLSGATYTSFGIGSALVDASSVETQGWLNKNLFRFVAPLNLQLGESDRVWMRFPLTAEEAKKEAEALEMLSVNKIVEQIDMDKGKVTAKDNLQLTPGMKPTWIELTKGTGEFNRDAPVDKTGMNGEEWKKLHVGPVYRLLVYERGGDAFLFKEGEDSQLRKVKREVVENWTFFAPEKKEPK